jgi:hypothetical protein
LRGDVVRAEAISADDVGDRFAVAQSGKVMLDVERVSIEEELFDVAIAAGAAWADTANKGLIARTTADTK